MSSNATIIKPSSSDVEPSLAAIKHGQKHKKNRMLLNLMLAVLLGMVATFSILLLEFALGKTAAFLLVFPVITFSAWYGGMRSGFITAVIAAIGATYLFTTPQFSLALPLGTTIVHVLLLLLGGITISVAIEKSREPNSIAEYKNRETRYLAMLLSMQVKIDEREKEIKARDEFLSIASHELKTPLTSMLMQIQTVLYNIRNVSLANFSVSHLLTMLDSAEKQSKRLSKMINDLLNVSLITTGKINLEREECDLVEITKDVVNNFSEKAKREGCTISLKADKPILGQWDKLRIEQVVTNLLSNAIKYGDSKPVNIEITNHHASARLEIADEGIGIPKERLERIFAKFERAVSSKKYEGLGVGLYITHQIVQAHGGSIHVTSKEGKGTQFTLDLPRK